MAAVELRQLTAAQVGECFMLQMMRDPPPPLAQICVEHNYVTRDLVDQILAHQHRLLRRFGSEAGLFGQVAVALQLITRDEMAVCLAKQREKGFQQKLGEVCIELGFLKPEDVPRILAEQELRKKQMTAEVPLFGRIALELG